jgi:hypothetical protein
MRNSEQKTRRHLDGANMDVGFGFVIIDLPILFLPGPAVNAVIARSVAPSVCLLIFPF